jgi:hypothetical protein
MKADAPAALKALASLGEAYAVIYLPGDPVPLPVTTAGDFRGRPFFMLGTVAHWIDSALEARVTGPALGYYDAKGLLYFVTAAANAPEVQAGLVVQAIDASRQQLEDGAGMQAAITALDPLGESTPAAPRPKPGPPPADA